MYTFTAFLSLLFCLLISSMAHAGQYTFLSATYLLLLNEKVLPVMGPVCSSDSDSKQNNCSQIVGAIANRMWMRADDGLLRGFYDATDYCEILDYDGHSDWRLPSKVELQGLVDVSSPFAPPPYIVWPLFVRTDAAYWSTENDGEYEKPGVDFTTGKTDAYNSLGDERDELYVRCVRNVSGL